MQEFNPDIFGGGDVGIGGGGGGYFDPTPTVDTNPFGGGGGEGLPRVGPITGNDPTPTPGILDNLGSAVRGGAGTFGDVAKAALPFVQLGATGFNIANAVKGGQQLAEQTKIARGAERRQEDVARRAMETSAPLEAFSQQQLQRAQAGQLDPATEAQLKNWADGWKQKINDFAAKSGQGNSEQHIAWLQWIDQQVIAARSQAIQQMEAGAVSAAGTAGGILSAGAGAAQGAGSQAAGQQTGLTNLIAEANKQLAALTASVG